MENEYEELMQQVKVIKDRIRGVVHRVSTGVYLHGRPGTSKTYMVRTTLDTMQENYEYANGHLTPVGLFDLIAENRDRTIVLDDVSAMFNQPIALQILLAALGNCYDGSKIRLVRYKKFSGDQVVPFSGGIVMLSNLPLAGHHREVLAALNDRINVVSYEPSDEQIIALIYRIAQDGIAGVSPENARMVATFLIEECKPRCIRPSVRLFVDKALKDFQLHASGKSETDWRDLVVSNLEQQLVELQHPTTDLSRDEKIAADRRIALDVHLSFANPEERVQEWKNRTGKTKTPFYARIKELKMAGQLLT